MPQHKMPKTLRAMGINYMVNIILHLKKLKADDVNGDILSAMTSSAEEIFGILPINILEDILQMYESYYPGGIDSYFPLEVLINFQTTRLSLHFPDYMQSSVNPEVVLKKIGSVASSITDLKLSGSILKNTDCFVYYTLCHLTNITHLTLIYLKLDDSVPITIGRYCTVIEDVTITGWGITDVGLTCLVPRVSQSLKRIKLEYDKYQIPNVTKFAVVHVLLHSPKLEAITVPHLKEALEILMEEYPKSGPPLTLSFCEFYEQPQSTEPFSPHFSKCLSSMCPQITEISLVVSEPKALVPLSKLKCLTTLKIAAQNAYSDNYIPLFPNGVSELLKNIGYNITDLELNIPELDLTVVDSYCPSLYKLECIDFEILNRTLPPKNESFKNLKSLKMFASNENCLTSHDLLHLLCYCDKLQLLYLSNCDYFSDRTLKRILQSNPLSNISLVEFTDLCAITTRSVKELIFADNNLTQFHIFSCDFVSENDVEVLISAVKQLNLNLSIKFNR